MSDFDSHPEDGLDRWLANQRRKLADDLAAALDVEAGLGEVLIHPRHADLLADLGRSLDVEAGLAAIGITPRNAPLTPGSHPAAAEHVAAMSLDQAKAEQPEFTPAAAFQRPITPLAKRTHPVSKFTGLASNLRRVHDRVIVAVVIVAVVVVIALAAITITAIQKSLPSSPPTTAAPTLEVLDYGVKTQSHVGTCDPKDPVRFTFTVRALGSGTLHYTWRPDNSLSSQPARATMTFTGTEQTQHVDYIVPRSSGQRLEGGMTVEITAPDSFLGASYDKYNPICDGSGSNTDGASVNDGHSLVPRSNGEL